MIPTNLFDEYTLNGKIPVFDYYFPSSSDRMFFNYTSILVENFIEKAIKKTTMHYPNTDQWLYEAIEKYSLKGHKTLIIGSEEPCYEGVAIHYGADVTMVEYQKVTSEHPKLKTMTIKEFENSSELYDSAISISSVEHSGLGRYGDNLDPNGDLKAMKTLYDKLKLGGICFLAVPIGLDQVLWNAHRVYGKLRFPLLINGWEVIDSFGMKDSDFDVDEYEKMKTNNSGTHQPIFVLKKK